MSMNKDQVEWLRLQAQKCDHQSVAPGTHFDIAADLRASKGRGGKMFEKRKDRANKYVVDESKLYGRPMNTKLFDPGNFFGVELRTPSKSKRRSDVVDDELSGFPAKASQVAETVENNLTDADRLQRLYRILGYAPAGFMQPPTRAPKCDLKSALHLPHLPAHNFNRNAKGWTAADHDSQQDQGPDDTEPQPVRPSDLPPFDTVDRSGGWGLLHIGNYDYNNYKPSRPKSWPSSLWETYNQQDEFRYGDYNPRPKGWQSVQFEDPRPQRRVQYGDYNPRPKAWMSTLPEEEDYSPEDEVQYGDYNARPKAWESSYPGDIGPRDEIQYRDYNARPKAWPASHLSHSSPPGDIQYGDYNARAKAWETSHKDHYKLLVPKEEVQFGNFNSRPKAWESARPGHKEHLISTVHYGDYNPRPRAWQSAAPCDDSDTSSFSSWTSIDSDHYRNIFHSRALRPVLPACDV